MSQGRYARLPNDSFPGPLVDGRAITTAAGGTNITATLTVGQVFPFLDNTKHVSAIPWNFSTAVVAQFLLCPYLWIVKGAAVGGQAPPTFTDYSDQGQQPAGTGITLSSLATLAAGEALYLGADVPFGGVAVDMSAAVNGTGSVLTVEYWNGTAWVSLSATDNTASGGATFAQDGLVTWTMPAAGAWVKAQLSNGLANPPLNLSAATKALYLSNGINADPQYWTRWTVSVALDSSTVPTTMIALNQSTAYVEVLPANVLEFRPVKAHGGVSALQCKADAGTFALILNCFTDNPIGSF
jgi:hypothetical protein